MTESIRDLPVDPIVVAQAIVTIVREQLGHYRHDEVAKGNHDLATQLDGAIEAQLKAKLLELLPDSSAAGEESGGNNAANGYRWVIDPIDGTVNFARGYEFFTSVISLLDSTGPLIALIYQPAQDTMTVAVRSKACKQWPNAQAGFDAAPIVLRTGNRPWEQSLYSLNLSPKIASSPRQKSMELINALLDETLGVRVLVSQAYEALKLAEGGISGVISLQSSGGWSRDAARLVCESAGANSLGLSTRQSQPFQGSSWSTPTQHTPICAKSSQRSATTLHSIFG